MIHSHLRKKKVASSQNTPLNSSVKVRKSGLVIEESVKMLILKLDSIDEKIQGMWIDALF